MYTIKTYLMAQTLEEAYSALQKNKSNVILGGCGWLKMTRKRFWTGIDLSGLGLDRIEQRDGWLEIGAMVTLRQLETDPALRGLFPGRCGPAGIWRVTPDTLYLNGTAISRAGIRQVYCWPNRDALGHAGTGWPVNIETDRGHHVLRSLTRGEEAERSARQLQAMVTALGYGSSWRDQL